MFYNFILLLSKIYVSLLRRKFNHIGKNTVIKPFLNSSNEQHIYIGDYSNIGSFCRLTVSTEFGGFKCKSKRKIRLKIGNHVDIGNNSFISANNNIQIGNHVITSSSVFITDHDHGFKDIKKDLHHQPLTDDGFVIIKDNVFIGVNSSILKNVTIGEHSVIAANSVVTKDVPPFSIMAGNPAKLIKKYDFNKKRWIKVNGDS